MLLMAVDGLLAISTAILHCYPVFPCCFSSPKSLMTCGLLVSPSFSDPGFWRGESVVVLCLSMGELDVSSTHQSWRPPILYKSLSPLEVLREACVDIWGAVLSSLNFRWKRVRCRLVLVMKLRFCNELFVYACMLVVSVFFVTDWPYVALAWSSFLTIGPTLQWLLVIRVGWIVWLEAWWQLWRLFSFLRVVSLEVGVPPCLSLKKLYMSFWFSGCKRSRLKSLEITILSFSSERRYYQLESLPHVTIVYCLAEKWIRV